MFETLTRYYRAMFRWIDTASRKLGLMTAPLVVLTLHGCTGWAPTDPAGALGRWKPMPTQQKILQTLSAAEEAEYREFANAEDPTPEDIQVLAPMQRGELGARNLNTVLQEALTPAGESVQRYGWIFRVGDKVMQTVNNYDKDVFNGDIGRIESLNTVDREVVVRFEDRKIKYDFEELDELVLSFAVTIHKSQGSEYPCVVIPLHTQHYMMLQRNLLYTAVTRGRRLVIIVGTQKALAIAVKKRESSQRITTLQERLQAAGDT